MGRQGQERRRTAVAVVAFAAALSTAVSWERPAQAQSPSADQLVARAGDYLAEFVDRFSSVVAEEKYVQRLISDRQTRTLVSDFLIVQIPESNDWTSFRDVFEVDGRPVRDRDERLVKLFLEPRSGTTLQRASAIAEEGARYNLRGIGTLNNPLLALAFVQDRYRQRFRWRLVRNDKGVGPDVWSVRFEEFVVPTLLKGNGNRDLPTNGQVWIDAPTGRVMKTELRVELGGSIIGRMAVRNRSEIVATFGVDDRFQIAVPTEMRENHFFGNNDVTTVATYGRFRRFGVQTGEVLQPR
jgi:hypothetical protein